MEQHAELGNQQASLTELAWLAGIVDGEGYIGVQYYNTRKRNISISAELSICNTDEQIIFKSQNIIQKLGVNPYIQTYMYGLKNKPKNKKQQKIVVHRMKQLSIVLKNINPYLTGNKKERAELVLEFCKSRMASFVPGRPTPYSNREIEIIEECMTKQRRGASETVRRAQQEQLEKIESRLEKRRNSLGQFARISVRDDTVQPFAKA
jgi:hypothetical protein